MFTGISWSSYLAVVSVLLLIWYSALILKFYGKDLKKIISGEKKLQFPFWKKNSKKQLKESGNLKSLSSSFSESFDTLQDAEELSGRIVKAIEESAERELSGEEFQNYMRMILEEYPYVRISSLRENINSLIVSQCEKHSKLHLTFGQADSLWEETL